MLIIKETLTHYGQAFYPRDITGKRSTLETLNCLHCCKFAGCVSYDVKRTINMGNIVRHPNSFNAVECLIFWLESRSYRHSTQACDAALSPLPAIAPSIPPNTAFLVPGFMVFLLFTFVLINTCGRRRPFARQLKYSAPQREASVSRRFQQKCGSNSKSSAA